MTKWIDITQAASELRMDVAVLRRIVKSSTNPPPFVRPGERSMLFDVEALHEWQRGWTANKPFRSSAKVEA